MVLKEDVSILGIFKDSLEISKEELSKVKVREELTYDYAIVRMYSKELLTSSAIYTLLLNGYPDDALALCRKLYESLVIIDTLLKGKQKNDMQLLERFMDAPLIMALKNDYGVLSYVLEKDSNDSNAKSKKDIIDKEIQKYCQKYQKKEIKEFKDYLWSGYDNFGDMARHSDFGKAYFYALLSDQIHMNALGAFHYLDNSEPGILLGASEKGKQKPIEYASLFLYCSAGIIHDHYPDICPQSVVDHFKQFAEAADEYSRKSASSTC